MEGAKVEPVRDGNVPSVSPGQALRTPSLLLAVSQQQARAGRAGAGATSPVVTLCQRRSAAECLPTLMTDREQTLRAAACSCQPFAPRLPESPPRWSWRC